MGRVPKEWPGTPEEWEDFQRRRGDIVKVALYNLNHLPPEENPANQKAR
jgi:hypothetical protein